MSESYYGGGFFNNYDWDDFVEECIYPPGDCDSCPLRNVCKNKKEVSEE